LREIADYWLFLFENCKKNTTKTNQQLKQQQQQRKIEKRCNQIGL
jgi:hypothetical protein